MRPHALALSSTIFDLLPVDGELAVLTQRGLAFVDDELRAATDDIELTGGLTSLVALADGRLAVHGAFPSPVRIGRRGAAFETVVLGDSDLASGLVATATGFVAWTAKHLVIDHHGERRTVEHAWPDRGGVRWGDRTVLASAGTLEVLDASGSSIATVTLACAATPAACGARLAVIGGAGIAILDDELREVHQLPARARVTSFGDGVLCHDETAVTYWDPTGRTWSFTGQNARILHDPIVVGERVVIGSWDAPKAWILGRDGEVQATLELAGTLVRACALGDGIALIDRVGHAATWWQPAAAHSQLAHDFAPSVLAPIPGGIATADDNVLYTWRLDRDGPDVPAASIGAPLATPIVAGGSIVTLDARGRFASRGRAPDGHPVRVAHAAAWRPAITRDGARPLIERLVQRRTEGTVPAIAADASAWQTLAQLPLEETVTLHARALFAPTTLETPVRQAAELTRVAFFAELAGAVGVSGRVLLAAVKARRFPLDPPTAIPGYEYLGSFASSGELTVCDPCYFGKRSPRGAISLSVKLEGLDGIWHVFVRPGVGEHAGRSAELVAIHSEGFPAFANEPLGVIGVDAGCAGVFDRACPRPEAPYDEGVFSGRSAMARSGLGDGAYPVYGGYTLRKLSKVRIHFLGPTLPETDATMPRKTAARRYAASERFEVGETVEHPKFGSGTVTRIGLDGKIEVVFGEERRVLVHARKA